MNGRQVRNWGQASRASAWVLNACGCDAMTDTDGGPTRRSNDSRHDAGLGSFIRHGTNRSDITGRNALEGHTAGLSHGSQLSHRRPPTSLDSPLIATTDAMNASELESTQLLYDDRPFRGCGVAEWKSQPEPAFAGLTA